jgi:hypothetical protein
MRALLVGGFVIACGAFAAFPLSIHFKTPAAVRAERVELRLATWPNAVFQDGNQNKDYGLWYPVGLVARSGSPLYPQAAGVAFPFMYPPFAGAGLAWLSHLGQTGMVVALVLANAVAWFLAVWLSVTLVAGGRPTPSWVWGLPSTLCLFFVYDMFLLGQPNLGLLVLLLAGFHTLRSRPAAAGLAFAAAAALKAFPAVVLVYLLWRRHWAAAGVMVATTAGLLVLAPVPTRGWDRNLGELRAWAGGMLFAGSGSGVGQRPEQSQGWRNQSLLAVGHRLLRPVNARADEFNAPEQLYVNVLDLDQRTAGLVIAGFCGLLGLGFVLAMPPAAARTRESDAAEFALLTVLVTVGTPYAFGYYFVWLLLPATVLVWHATTGRGAVRRGSWACLAVGFGLIAAGAPLTRSRWPQAVGAYLWGALVLAAGLGWHLRRATDLAPTPPAGDHPDSTPG